MSFHKKNKLVLISCLALIITGIVFIGLQLSNTNYLLAFYRKYISVVFNSCLCLILIGCGYILLQFNNKKARAFLVAVSLVLTLICALTILQYIFNFEAGIDGLFVPGRYANPAVYQFTHGQMLPATAVVYLFLGLALMGFCTRIRFVHILSQYFLHVVSVFCSILLIGFAYSDVSVADMQVHVLNYLWLGGWIITLSIAASFRHPSLGLTRLFNGGLVGNKMARRLFAMMAVSILLFGLVKVKYLGFTIWQYDTGISLFVFCILVAALLIIWHTADWLNKTDLRRIEAEAELKVLNRELGKRVEERTAELSDLLEKYKESELKFRTLAERSMVGIYRVQNGRLTYINLRFADIFGYRPEELMDTIAMEAIVPESYRSIALDDVKACIEAADDSMHQEAMTRKKNGETIWVEFYSNTAVIGGELTIIGSIIDITERKMAEDSLQKSKVNLGAILETSNTCYALLDKELNIVTFNQRALQFVNLQFGAFPNPGDSPFDFLPKDRISVFNGYANEVLKGENISNEVSYLQPDGTRLFYNVNMSPIRDNQNEIVGIMLAISDITDIKKYTNAIEEQNKNLLEIAWLQSHIVRAPLARMMGIINLLRNHDLDSTEHCEYLSHLSTSADELDTIIKDITTKTEEIK